MKLSSALVVSMTTAASAAMAVDDAPLLLKDIGSDTVSAASAVGDTASLLTHHHPHASTHVRESLSRSDDTTAAVATSALLQNEEHTSSGGSKNVDVDVGLLPISERRLDSVQEESLLGVDDAMTAVVTSALLHKNDRNSGMALMVTLKLMLVCYKLDEV